MRTPFILAAVAWACASCGGDVLAPHIPATPPRDVRSPEDLAPPWSAEPAPSLEPAAEPAPEPGPVAPEPAPEAPIATGCAPLALTHGSPVGSYSAELYGWSDRRCRPRSAALLPNDVQDAAGKWGGTLRRYTYEVDGAPRTCSGSNPNHPGFGHVVNHFGSSSQASIRNPGAHRVAFAGEHHAIHEFTWSYLVGGQPLDVTVQWLFATGVDHPLWAVTFDTSRAPPDSINADTRAPYGEIEWDGGAGASVDGVGWGDHYAFRSTASGPLTMASGWDYSQPNVVPYVHAWSTVADAEMGVVQTQTQAQHAAGGYTAYQLWGKSDADGPMPADWTWTYQLNQYELPYTTKSKRMAWGMNYGAVGKNSYPLYGESARADGYPHQSYSVRVVLGTHSSEAVAAQVAQTEAAQEAQLSAAVGSVVLSGPAGLARADAVAYVPAGYNHVYGTWEVTAAANAATFTLTPSTRPLASPVFVVRGWTKDAAPESVRRDGALLVAGVHYYASVDAERDLLWLTLAAEVARGTRIEVR